MTVRPSLALALAVATALSACATHPGVSTPPTHGTHAAMDKATQLNHLYDQFWEESLKLNPIQATFQGDPRYNDQLPNFLGADFRGRSHEFTQRWLDKVQKIGPAGLDGQALISYEIFVHDAKSALDGERFPNELIPINQFYNLANLAVMLGSGTGAQPFKTVQDYDNWSRRAAKMPAIFDQAIANMREGVSKGIVQPRVLMLKVVPQLDAVIKDKPEDTLFWMPVKTMPPSFSDADKARITDDYRDMIGTQLLPAYKRLRAYIADDYMQHTRDTVGLDKLPGGAPHRPSRRRLGRDRRAPRRRLTGVGRSTTNRHADVG